MREENKKLTGNRKLLMAVLVLLAALAFHVLARILYTKPGDYTLEQWLWGHTVYQHEYLYGWLVNNNYDVAVVVLTVVMAVLGKYRFSFVVLGCSCAGCILGEWLGVNPAGQQWGHGHDGWLIWLLFVVTAIFKGVGLEKKYKEFGTYRHPWFLRWATGLVLILISVLLFVVMDIQADIRRMG